GSPDLYCDPELVHGPQYPQYRIKMPHLQGEAGLRFPELRVRTAGLVRVEPLLDGEVVREELERDDVHERGKGLHGLRGPERPVEEVRVHGGAFLDDAELPATDRVDRPGRLRRPLGGRPSVRDMHDELAPLQ